MIIDSHLHLWTYHPSTQTWIDGKMQVLKRDYMPLDLYPLFEKLGVEKGVAVQAAQTEEETNFLLGLAEKHEHIGGVVGWVDLLAEDLEYRLDQWSDKPLLKGFRHILQDEPNSGFMLQVEFIRGLKHLAEKGFTYDLLIRPHQFEEAIKMVSQVPELPIVLDHIAKPNIAQQRMAPWQKYIRTLADFPNVYCKLSGMITESDWQNWKAEDFPVYTDIVLEAFGPNRIMFGSDWPVCLLAGAYEEVLTLAKTCISALSKLEQENIWRNTAEQFYQL